MKKNIEGTLYTILLFGFTLHFIYTLGISIYDVFNLKRIEWEEAKMVCYGGEDSFPTCDFISEGRSVKVSREYEAFYGFLVRLWGMEIEYEEDNYYDITFYVKEKDYIKLQRGEIIYPLDWAIFGKSKDYTGNIDHQEYIPFFGVRKNSDSSPYKLTLLLDLWLDNHKGLTISVFLILSLIVFAIFSKGKNSDDEKYSTLIENALSIASYGSIIPLIACMIDAFIL